MKGRSYLKKLFAFIVVLTIFLAVASASTEPWKFGIISDTQWTKPDDGKNPNTCAADIIKQVDRQFIYEGVKLVIAVGDTVDVGSATSIGTRALYAQDLYNAGIGFYPLRGNHEAAESPPDLTSGAEFLHAFPQIGTGRNNITQSDSSKFYTPVAPFSGNDQPVSQDLHRVGYSIVTVDGPRITLDYYGPKDSYPSAFSTTPVLEFVKLDSLGYSLNSKEFLVAQGESYTGVLDRYHGTTA